MLNEKEEIRSNQPNHNKERVIVEEGLLIINNCPDTNNSSNSDQHSTGIDKIKFYHVYDSKKEERLQMFVDGNKSPIRDDCGMCNANKRNGTFNNGIMKKLRGLHFSDDDTC